MKFPAIDGLRAWLAWSVAVSHIVIFSGLSNTGLGPVFNALAGFAVLIFIIISGFVISGMIIEKKEPWWPYIIRRFFRIFPLYLVLLVVSGYVIPLFIPSEQVANPEFQWLAHLALVQGVVPDNVLLNTAIYFLPPAWSLSLEWQFYIIAPALVVALSKRTLIIPTLAGLMVLTVSARLGAFGIFNRPSFLPLALYLFTVGILCRLWFEKMQKVSLPQISIVCVLICGAVFVRFEEARWIACWAAFMVFLLNESRWQGGIIKYLMKVAFASKGAIYFGERSYSIYLAHWPALCLASIGFEADNFSQSVEAVTIAVRSVTLTLILSHLLYRYVEQPFIRLGSRIAKSQIVAIPA